MPTTINVQPGSFERLEFSSTVHSKDDTGDRFAVFRVRLVQSEAKYPHHETNVFVKKAADLDPLIAEATRLREQLASAEAVEADNKRAAEAVPLADALKDPAGFVAGMTETRADHKRVWLILATGVGGCNGRYWSRSMNGGNGGWSERPGEYSRFASFAEAQRVALAERFRSGKYEIIEAVESEPHAEDAHSDHAPVG